MWSTAANMEVAMPVHDPVQRHKLITSPLPPSGSIAESADSKTRHSSKKRKTSAGDNKKPHPTTAAVQGPFDPIDEATYDHLRRQAIQQGVPTRDQPLNPQQRDAARSLVEYAIFYHAHKGTTTAKNIVDMAKEKRLAQISKVMGAAGVGKSAMILAAQRALEEKGLGLAVVTAYTGVAASPFAGPTLLSLMNMNAHTKGQEAQNIYVTAMTNIQNKFLKECGAPADKVSALIIDEISFVDAAMLGHVSNNLSMLLRYVNGNENGHDDASNGAAACGGLSVMLCGDCHQKNLPNSTPWCTALVNAAHSTNMQQRSNGQSARDLGLDVLRQAKRVTLSRQMRAIEDQEFVSQRMQMRETTVVYPVRKEFLDSIKEISRQDVEDDQEWLFAPIGVVGHWEGDAINMAQVEHFAYVNNLPVVKWRLTIDMRKDYKSLLHAEILEELYETEPNTWAYFVQGAPILITDNMRSTRKLVNGTPGLLYSLNIDEKIEQGKVAEAHRRQTARI